MQLYFGPNLRYFFNDGKGNYRYRAPEDLMKFFRTVSVSEIYSVAFGEGDSYYISYRATNGTTGAWWELEQHYPKLHSWFYSEGLAHDWASVIVTLGVNGAFFAYSSQGHRWRNIPEGASDYYQKFMTPALFPTKRVRCMDFGANGTYLGIGMDNTWFWDLGNEYPHLSSLGIAKEIPRAKYVALNPFARDQHFVIFEDGSTHYSLPQEWAGDIAALFQQYASQSVQAQQPSHWGRPGRLGSGSSSYTAPVQSQQPSTVNQALSLGNNVLDAYNNVTNAGQMSTGYGGGGGGFDVNQAMNTMQSSANAMGQGVNMMNQIASNGLVVGQVAGAVMGCTVQ